MSNDTLQVYYKYKTRYNFYSIQESTVRSNIHLEFLTESEATENFEKWDPIILGNQSKIRRANEIEKPNRTASIKRVRTDIDDFDKALSIQNHHSFDNVNVMRFKKRDQTKLATVRVNFKTVNDVEKALKQGLSLNSLFYKPKRFEHRTTTKLRCFKCQKFEHISLNQNQQNVQTATEVIQLTLQTTQPT